MSPAGSTQRHGDLALCKDLHRADDPQELNYGPSRSLHREPGWTRARETRSDPHRAGE